MHLDPLCFQSLYIAINRHILCCPSIIQHLEVLVDKAAWVLSPRIIESERVVRAAEHSDSHSIIAVYYQRRLHHALGADLVPVVACLQVVPLGVVDPVHCFRAELSRDLYILMHSCLQFQSQASVHFYYLLAKYL